MQKKNNIVIVLLLVLVLIFLAGCDKSKTTLDLNAGNIETSDTELNLEENTILPSIEIDGMMIEDINSIETIKDLQLDEKYVYNEPMKDEKGNLYVKLTDKYYVEDEETVSVLEDEIRSRELLPSKIYSVDTETKYIYEYKDNFYFIPVEKCEIGEERIVYRDYGIEICKKDNKFKMLGAEDTLIPNYTELNLCIDGQHSEQYEVDSLYDVYTNMWRIVDYNVYKLECENEHIAAKPMQEYIKSRVEKDWYKMHEIDLDNDLQTKEITYATQIFYSETEPYYGANICKSIISHRNDSLRTFYNIINFKNIANNKNVFYSGKHVLAIKENVILGYFLYDSNEGLIYVEKFANGENYENSKISEVAFTLDRSREIYDYNGERCISLWVFTAEVDETTENLKENTKIFIYKFDEYMDGYYFKTEDGREFYLNTSYT